MRSSSWLDERFKRVDREFEHAQKALELQAAEYERRLDDLNHAHANTERTQATFVSFDKWEDKMMAEAEARKNALERVDERIQTVSTRFEEKLDEYIKKYELDKREIDNALAIGRGAAEEAQRIAEEQGRISMAQAQEQTRKTNRNMAILALILTAVIGIANWVGAL